MTPPDADPMQHAQRMFKLNDFMTRWAWCLAWFFTAAVAVSAFIGETFLAAVALALGLLSVGVAEWDPPPVDARITVGGGW